MDHLLHHAHVIYGLVAQLAHLADTGAADEVGAVGDEVHAILAQKVLSLFAGGDLGIAQLRPVIVVDQGVVCFASLAGASEFLEGGAVDESIIAFSEGIILVVKAIRVLDADAHPVGDPTVEAGLTTIDDVVETDAGEPRSGHRCAAGGENAIIVRSVSSKGALESVALERQPQQGTDVEEV